MGSAVGCCAVLTGRDWGESNENLGSMNTNRSQWLCCRHSNSSAWVRSMYCVWRIYCVKL